MKTTKDMVTKSMQLYGNRSSNFQMIMIIITNPWNQHAGSNILITLIQISHIKEQ